MQIQDAGIVCSHASSKWLLQMKEVGGFLYSVDSLEVWRKDFCAPTRNERWEKLKSDLYSGH